MATPATDPANVLPALPNIEDGQVVYDRIMSAIEPELVSGNLSQLEEKYKNDTPEQKEERASRYAKAFEEYEKQYAKHKSEQANSIQVFRRQAMQNVEAHATAPEEQLLQSLESSINAQ